MSKTKINKNILALIDNLKFATIDNVDDTLNQLSADGNIDILGRLFSVFATIKNTEVRQKVFQFLCDIRDENAVNVIVEAISNPDFVSIRKDLIAMSWLSNLDYSGKIEFFVDLFINEQFDIAFESFTVIEEIIQRFEINNAADLIIKLELAKSNLDDSKLKLNDTLIQFLQNLL